DCKCRIFIYSVKILLSFLFTKFKVLINDIYLLGKLLI
ncbi:MAG: hypothetical protein ACI9L7_000252, partial [Candidatus Azotimanducaceae bacterium]